MSKKIRDYIFFIFVLSFIVGTTIISLYASGYKFNLSWPPHISRLLIRTGMIVVDSAPRGATIYLNDKPAASFSLNPWSKQYLTTAAKVKNVLPGEYTLKLERDGYWPLSKKISVYSGQTTFAENINLFRDDLPFFITAATTSEIALSANYKYLYIAGPGKIITLKNNEEKTLPLNGRGRWLKNQDQILVKGWLFPVDKTAGINYSQTIGAGANNWYYEENTKRLYYQNDSLIAYLEADSQMSHLVLSGGRYLAYEPHGDSLFYVAAESGQTILKKYSLKNQATEQQMILPNVGHYLFSPDGRPFITLYDDQNKTLYLINPENLAGGSRTINNIISWAWLDDNTLVYNNNWEIYLFDLRQNSASLLTRVGEEIRQIIWNSRNDYLIFSTDSGLNVYDLKIGLITKIFQAEKIGSPVLDDKNGTLYFWAKIGKQEGIYSLLLQ